MIDPAFEGDFYRYVHAAGYADRAWNRQVLEFYLPYFAQCHRVLDVGCGEGQMLDLLAANGIDAVGIDSDAAMVQLCRERGREVVQVDLFDYLAGPANCFDGIFSSNVIEHLSAEQAARFVQLSFSALRPGGILLIATPNPESLIVHLYEFWRDATHARLYNRPLLEYLLYRAGLRNVVSHENPHTAWTPPAILQEKSEQPSEGPVEVAARLARTELAVLPSVSLPEWPPPSARLHVPPFSGTVWDPPLPEQSLSWWRRPVFWLRRRLARLLVRSVMYEEFMVIERRAADLRNAVVTLSDETRLSVAGLASYTQTALQASVSQIGARISTLDQVFSRDIAELSAVQAEPLRKPREIFVVGIKPLIGGEVPPLPMHPAHRVSERGDAGAEAAPASSGVPQVADEGSPLPAPDKPEAGGAEIFPEPNVEPPDRAGVPEAAAGRSIPVVRQRTGALKAAVFTPYLPYPPDTGGKTRSYHLLRALTQRFDVDLYSVHYGTEPAEAIQALREQCCQVVSLALEKSWRTRDRWRRALARLPRSVDYFCTPDSLMRAQDYLRDGRYDVLVADEICMTPYAELASHLPRVVARQKVDHLHYQEMARARPWGGDKVLDSLEATRLQQYERAKMPIYQAYMACSDHDAAIIGRDAPGAPFLVIPNGVDLDTFFPSQSPKAGRPILLYVGAMNYYPNIDAVKFFFDGMYGRIVQAMPDVRVQIVGHSPPPEVLQRAQLPGVEVMGSVPHMRPYYDAATVFMVPLRLGGGTRLKIVEAMAMGLPVVSTSVGAEGLDIHPGQNILIADDASAFAGEVLRLFADAELRARLGEGGHRLAARYDWKELMRPFADLVEATARQRGAGGR